MVKDRGHFWAIFAIPHSALAPFVFTGFVVGLFLIVGGVLFGSVPFVVLGILVAVAWTGMLMAISLLFDEAVNWLDERLEPRPGEEDGIVRTRAGRSSHGTRTNAPPHIVHRAWASASPEPGVCRLCGGRLFAGRPSCPHCSAPVEDADGTMPGKDP